MQKFPIFMGKASSQAAEAQKHKRSGIQETARVQENLDRWMVVSVGNPWTAWTADKRTYLTITSTVSEVLLIALNNPSKSTPKTASRKTVATSMDDFKVSKTDACLFQQNKSSIFHVASVFGSRAVMI